jgi:hypothetical protein
LSVAEKINSGHIVCYQKMTQLNEKIFYF